MAIKHKTAYKMAVAALAKQRGEYWGDATLLERFPDYAIGQAALVKLRRIDEAIRIITEEHLG